MSDSYDDDCLINWAGYYFKNNYFLIKRLGYGSYASVWLSYDIKKKKYCAIKIHNSLDYDTGFKEYRIYKELKKLKIDNIISIYDHFIYNNDDKRFVCCVTNLMGYSLYDLLEKFKLSFKFICNVTIQILECLTTLHENGYIHGDIKPENILLTSLNNNCNELINFFNIDCNASRKNITKILDKKITELNNDDISYTSSSSDESIDSDISNIFDINDDTSDIKIKDVPSEKELYDVKDPIIKIIDIGSCINIQHKKKKYIETCYYQAPEILLGLDYDQSIDIWALGCTIYEILTGNILFDPTTYSGNESRYHLLMMIEKIGIIPNDMIENSTYKNIYFTHDKRIKGFKTYEKKLLSTELNYLNEDFLKLLLSMLQYKNRITAKDALKSLRIITTTI